MPKIIEQEVYIRIVRHKPMSGISKTSRKKIINKGVINLPEYMIGKICLVYPVTNSQKELFKLNTIGYKRAKKFIETLLKRPRDILKEFEVI